LTLFGNRVFIEVIKLKFRLLSWALIQYDYCPYEEDIDTNMYRRKEHVKMEKWGDEPTNQGMPRIASKPPRVNKKQEGSLQISEAAWPC
jgi:hypothetical protein